MVKNYRRRSISIPVELDELIRVKFNKSGYTFINDLLIELIELGILKSNEKDSIDNYLIELNNKLDIIIAKLNN